MTPRERLLPVSGPLQLRPTLAPLHGRFDHDGWWLTARTPSGPGTLQVSRSGGVVAGRAWGGGGDWLLDRLHAICGLEDDPARFVTGHPLVGELHRRHPGWRFGRTSLVFDALTAAVVAQKVTSTEAEAALRGLHRRFGDPAPGPRSDLALPPDPVRMAESPYWVYHRLHLEKQRAEVLRRLAADATRLQALAELDPASASHRLLRYPGVGPWTVSRTLSRSHGDPDQVDVGDFHLKHLVVFHLTGRARGSDEEMLRLLEEFRPHRGRVVRLLTTLGYAPRYGPRMAPRDITGI